MSSNEKEIREVEEKINVWSKGCTDGMLIGAVGIALCALAIKSIENYSKKSS